MATAAKKKKATRKKTAASNPTVGPHLPISEILAVITGSAGIFLFLALVSYHPTDPSWNTVSDGAGPDTIQNWMGAVGAYMGDALVAPLGIPSLVIPLALLLFSYSLLRYHMLNWPFLRVAASITLTFFSCLLLGLYPGQVSFRGEVVLAGGGIGDAMVRSLVDHFNQGGSLVLILAGLILSLQMTLAIEIGPPVLRVVHLFQRLLRGTLKATGGAVAVGAGAVGQAAVTGAASVGQRFKEMKETAREEAERRRAEREAEEAAREEQARRAKGAESATDGKRRIKVNGRAGAEAPASGPEERAPSGRTAEAEPVRGRPARAGIASEVAESEPEDLLDEPALEDEGIEEELEEDALPGYLEGGRGPGGPAAPRGPRQAGLPFGPKIVKSRYMEEPIRLSDQALEPDHSDADFELPSTKYLKVPPPQEGALTEEELIASARLLEEKLRDYGVEGRVVEIHPGPVITMYEYAPAPGVKVSKITNLSNDLALALRATAVRIVAPLPGKAAVGIEVPNRARQTVFLREIVEHEEFKREVLKLPMAIGKDIEGKPYAADMARMPHLLVAGSTGAGKSVAVNAMLISLLYARKPDEVRFILVDPKMIEFSVYNDIPHLLMPVVTDPKKAALALNWAVDEMTRRYQLLTLAGARNIANYNSHMEDRLKDWDPVTAPEGSVPPRKLPYIVIVIDELADLMMVAGKEVQESIVRLAQMARAAGIHMILATQRPSVDVITGLIKANFPARIAFKVSSKTDSRTILDANGAEYLLGNGDMLFLPPGTASLLRLHGAFVSDDEARVVVEHLRKQGQPRYEESLLATTENGGADKAEEEDDDYDEFYEQAKMIVLETGQASISTIQRRLKIGYNRSARMVERMCREGLVGPPTQGGKPREVYASKLQASIR